MVNGSVNTDAWLLRVRLEPFLLVLMKSQKNIHTSIKLLREESKNAQVRNHNQSLGSWAVLIWLSHVFTELWIPATVKMHYLRGKIRCLTVSWACKARQVLPKAKRKYTGRGLRKPPVFETWIWSVTANIQQLVKPQAVRLLNSPQTCSPIDSII